MMLADRHGRPVSEIASEYPDWEIEYWAAWLSREPSDGVRVERAVAYLHSTFIGVNSKKGSTVPKPHELSIPNYWLEKAEANRLAKSKEDANALAQAFKDAGCEVHYAKHESEYLDEH